MPTSPDDIIQENQDKIDLEEGDTKKKSKQGGGGRDYKKETTVAYQCMVEDKGHSVKSEVKELGEAAKTYREDNHDV